jgi:hypothetical protein
LLLIDFGLDEAGEISRRILRAEMARFHQDGVGKTLLHDVQLGADGYLLSATITWISPGKLGSSNLSV